jgi:hypothetical protein
MRWRVLAASAPKWDTVLSSSRKSPTRRAVSSVSRIAFGDPVVATFLEFLFQDRECSPVGLICLAVDLHSTVVRRGERILRFLAGAPQRGRQLTTGAAIPAGLQNYASLYSRLLAVPLTPSWHTRPPAPTHHGPAVCIPHPAAKEPAQTAAAPTTVTWYQYAMALPSQIIQCSPRAAAHRTVSRDRAGPPRPPARWH